MHPCPYGTMCLKMKWGRTLEGKGQGYIFIEINRTLNFKEKNGLIKDNCGKEEKDENLWFERTLEQSTERYENELCEMGERE